MLKYDIHDEALLKEEQDYIARSHQQAIDKIAWLRKYHKEYEMAKLDALIENNFATLTRLNTARNNFRYAYAQEYGWQEAQQLLGTHPSDTDDNSHE